MDNIKDQIDRLAQKVAAAHIEAPGSDLTDLVVKTAREQKMTTKLALRLTELTNRHAFGLKQARNEGDEFKIAEASLVKLALQSNFYDENTSSAAPRPLSGKTKGSTTAQSAPRKSSVEMGSFIVDKLKGEDRKLKGERGGINGRLRQIIDQIKGLLTPVKKAGLEWGDDLKPEAKWLLDNVAAHIPFEKQAFVNASQERSYQEMATESLAQAIKLANEATDLRERAKRIDADRQSIDEQVKIAKQGIEVTR